MLVGIAALVVALGIVALIYGFMQRMKAGRVADAPLARTGDVASRGDAAAGPRGAISAEGRVVCPEPLMSPVSGRPCLYYEVKVTAEWKDGDHHKTKELAHEKRAARFSLDDGSGPVSIDAHEGGDFEPSESKTETKTTSLLGGITGQALLFGQFEVQTGMLSMGTKYTVKEEILPMQEKLYVCGKSTAGGIGAPSWRMMLMSNKSRDELLAHAQQGAKMFLMGGAGAVGVGAVVGVVATLVAGKPADASPSAQASATTQAAPGKPGTPAPPPAKKK